MRRNPNANELIGVSKRKASELDKKYLSTIPPSPYDRITIMQNSAASFVIKQTTSGNKLFVS